MFEKEHHVGLLGLLLARFTRGILTCFGRGPLSASSHGVARHASASLSGISARHVVECSLWCRHVLTRVVLSTRPNACQLTRGT